MTCRDPDGERGQRARAAILALLLGVATTSAHAASLDAADPRNRRGLELATAGHCEEAIPLLAPAHSEESFDLRAAVADVRCRMRLRRYADARALLELLRARRPDLAELDLYLAITSYHTGDRAGAKLSLARVQEELAGRMETHLYQGILALEDGVNDVAAAAFDAAREIDAERADPLASYYAGVARARLGLLAEARADAQRVLEAHSTGIWAERAHLLVERIDQRLSSSSWRVSAGAGYEFDTNVIRRGEDVSLPDDVSDEADARLTWSFRGSAELARSRLGNLGISADYLGTRHDELRAFDVQYPTVSLWWRQAIGTGSLVRVQYRFGYAWVDYEPFLETHSLGLSFVRTLGDAGRAKVGARSFAYRYRDEPNDVQDGTGAAGDPCPDEAPGVPFLVCGPPDVDEGERLARSGIGYALEVGYAFSPPHVEDVLEIESELSFQQYFADGRESDYLLLSPGLGARMQLPGALFASARASYTYRPFRSRSSLPDLDDLQAGVQFEPTRQRRRDHIVRVSAALGRTFWEHVSLEGRYTYVDNNSNQKSADYERHTVGAYVTVQLHD